MKEGWEVKKLGEVAFYPNKRISLSDLTPLEYVGVECMVKDKGGVAFSDKLPNTDTAIEFIENDILIGNIRPYLKKIWLSDRHGGASGDVVNIRISEEYKSSLSAAYLHKVLSTDAFFEYDNSNTHGAKMPRGDRKAIAKYKVSLPPKSTQLAIVAELDQINDLIRLKKEQLKEYDNLAQSIFYDMFGDPVENEKGWEVKKLGEVGEIVTGSTPSTTDNTNWNGEINWVTPAELDNQLFLGATQRRLTEKGAKGLTLMPVGTVLLSSRAPIGKIAITTQPMCCNQGFKNIICGKLLNNIFLYYYLLTTLENIKALGCGATFKEVSKKAIHSYETILPPLSLQQEFSTRIEQIEKQKTEVQKTITDLETLLAARMQHWFE